MAGKGGLVPPFPAVGRDGNSIHGKCYDDTTRKPAACSSAAASSPPASGSGEGVGTMYNVPQSYKRCDHGRYPPPCAPRFNPASNAKTSRESRLRIGEIFAPDADRRGRHERRPMSMRPLPGGTAANTTVGIVPGAVVDRHSSMGGEMSAASVDELRTEREPQATRYRDEDFPGCESFQLPASELDHYEYRLEFWDGATETAWKVCEPTSIQHEEPSRRLVQMAERVASLRGSAIECFGSGDLVRRDASGRKRWLMQADEVLYLHPDRVRLDGPTIAVDADSRPDVVLEVEHTTDAPSVLTL